MSTPFLGRVLVVDDQVDLTELIEQYLSQAGMEVLVRHDGMEAVQAVRQFDPDVVVLDLGLPGLDGIEVCRQVRAFSECHVLMLTARDDEVDKIVGLAVGADDYVTKPFSPRELVARTQAMLRRARSQSGEGGTAPAADSGITATVRTIGELVINDSARQVHLAGQPVPLTRIEFDLLATLAAHPQLVLSRRQLVEMVWDMAWQGDDHLVDVHIARLRKKLGEDVAQPRFIHTVRGVGYRMGEGR